jgi:hypothetical protein
MQTQPASAAPHEISGVVDALVTTARGADGSLAFHLVVGPADRPEECDRIEFALDAEYAAVLFGLGPAADRPAPAADFTDFLAPMPCRVGVEFHSAAAGRW